MIEYPLSTLTTEDVKEPDARTLGCTLLPTERLDASVVPLQRLRNMDEDTYEEVVQIWAYRCLKVDGKYAHVHRVGGAGDKGRDVIAYLDDTLSKFDLYQCKHYDHELNYSDLYGEIGKLLTYTYIKAYPIPQHYYILCPFGLAQSFRDLLLNDAALLKKLLIAEWDTKVVVKVGKTNGKKLDANLKAYIESFDYRIIKEIDPLIFVEDFQEKGAPYFFWYFGGGLHCVKKTQIEIPKVPKENERNYITNLYEAYTEHAGKNITPGNITNIENEKYNKHLDRSRSVFYAAEEIRLTSRQSTPPDSDEFDELKNQINTFIGDTYDDVYKDGFAKVKKVVEKAGDYKHAENLLIGQFLDSNAKQGVCHHLSNEGALTWKTKK